MFLCYLYLHRTSFLGHFIHHFAFGKVCFNYDCGNPGWTAAGFSIPFRQKWMQFFISNGAVATLGWWTTPFCPAFPPDFPPFPLVYWPLCLLLIVLCWLGSVSLLLFSFLWPGCCCSWPVGCFFFFVRGRPHPLIRPNAHRPSAAHNTHAMHCILAGAKCN